MKRRPLTSGWCQTGHHDRCLYELGTEKHPAQCACPHHDAQPALHTAVSAGAWRHLLGNQP